MAIRCNKGGEAHKHETVAEVRACYGVENTTAGRGYRTNRFDGFCSRCGGAIPKEEGRLDQDENGKWKVSHPDGCPERPAKIDAPKFKDDQDRFATIPRGHYATLSLTGNNDYDFWRVDRPEQGQYAGRTFVKRIVGGKPDLNVSKVTRIAALTAILDEGIDACGFRYGQELGKCRHCNRHLTDELSRSLSAGPECRSKRG